MKQRSGYLLSLLLSPSVVLLPGRLLADASRASKSSPADLPPSGSHLLQDIHDITGPILIPEPFPFMAIGGALLLIAAVLCIVIYLMRRRRQRKFPVPARWADQALARLAEAKKLLAEQSPTLYAAVVADILRHYIEKRFNLATNSRTTTEFFHALEQGEPDQAGALQEYFDRLRSCFTLCDLAKYASYSPGQENIANLETTVQAFIRTTSDSNQSAE